MYKSSDGAKYYSAFEALHRALEAADDAQSATGGYANRLHVSLGDGGRTPSSTTSVLLLLV